MPQRIDKINELLKRELGRVILRDISLPKNILVTISEVETTKDLREAKVFISVFPDIEIKRVLNILGREVHNLRQDLNKRLSIRHLPKMRFLEDQELKEAQRIEEVLRDSKIEENDS